MPGALLCAQGRRAPGCRGPARGAGGGEGRPGQPLSRSARPACRGAGGGAALGCSACDTGLQGLLPETQNVRQPRGKSNALKAGETPL